jgi:hypothetical protein
MAATRLSSLRSGRSLLPRNIFLLLVLISVRGWVNPRAWCGREDYLNWKKKNSPKINSIWLAYIWSNCITSQIRKQNLHKDENLACSISSYYSGRKFDCLPLSLRRNKEARRYSSITTLNNRANIISARNVYVRVCMFVWSCNAAGVSLSTIPEMIQMGPLHRAPVAKS